MQYIKKKICGKQAQGMVEFCLSMPILILLLGIMIGCAQMVYIRQVASNAISTGSRIVVTNDLQGIDVSGGERIYYKNNLMDTSQNDKMTSMAIAMYDEINPMLESAGFNIRFKSLAVDINKASVGFNGDNYNQTYVGTGNNYHMKTSLTVNANTLLPVYAKDVDGKYKLQSKVQCTEHLVVLLEY